MICANQNLTPEAQRMMLIHMDVHLRMFMEELRQFLENLTYGGN